MLLDDSNDGQLFHKERSFARRDGGGRKRKISYVRICCGRLLVAPHTRDLRLVSGCHAIHTRTHTNNLAVSFFSTYTMGNPNLNMGGFGRIYKEIYLEANLTGSSRGLQERPWQRVHCTCLPTADQYSESYLRCHRFLRKLLSFLIGGLPATDDHSRNPKTNVGAAAAWFISMFTPTTQ